MKTTGRLWLRHFQSTPAPHPATFLKPAIAAQPQTCRKQLAYTSPGSLYGIWIIYCASCSTTGWSLSALSQLHAWGYLVVFATLLLAAGWRDALAHPRPPAQLLPLASFRHLKCLFRRPLPFVFLLLAVLAAVGGVLYAPNNPDALTYRLPRVLHWIAGGHWHWIDNAGGRLNYSATGFEWLMVPWLLFTGTDRLLFGINLISYLMLPGLLFSVFRQLGIDRRVAWNWMWLVPSGYCFVLQAGSLANDAFAAVYLLASLHFSLKARTSRRIAHLWLALLAAALLTGAKASNLPLLLPCLIAMSPSLHLLKHRLIATTLILIIATISSHLPIALLNHHYTGHWSGDPHNQERLRLNDPLAGVVGNTLQLAVQNLAPPILPSARQWTPSLEAAIPVALSRRLKEAFPRFSLALGELPIEEGAGIGLGIAGLLILSSLVATASTLSSTTYTTRYRTQPPPRRLGIWIAAAGGVSLLFYMATLGSESTARLVVPYYPCLIALPLFIPGHSRLVRTRTWRIMTLLAAATTLPALIASPARPLWPAQTIFHALIARYPESALVQRACRVYEVYSNRPYVFDKILAHLPTNTSTVGLVSNGDHPETSLWRPFGSRRIIHLSAADERCLLHRSDIEWIAVSESGLRSRGYHSIDDWLHQSGGQLIATLPLTLKASAGEEQWYIVKVRRSL